MSDNQFQQWWDKYLHIHQEYWWDSFAESAAKAAWEAALESNSEPKTSSGIGVSDD